MKLLVIGLVGTAVAATGVTVAGREDNEPRPSAPPTTATPGASATATRPGFAASLAQRPPITGPDAWAPLTHKAAWQTLAANGDRQAARWAYARSLIGGEFGAEALGVLDVMQQDDPDLRMVDAFRLARGAALTQMKRFDDAAAQFAESDNGAPLVGSEACAWQMRLLAEAERPAEALARVDCAWPALKARGSTARAPFLVAAARAGVDAGKPDAALRWLASMPDRDPAANLYRGRAYAALGKPDQARLRLARAIESGTAGERADARLAIIEAGVADGGIPKAAALRQLAQLRFGWRGDHVEERALRLSYRLSDETGDTAGAFIAGATLLRYFDPQHQPAGFAAGVQARLAVLIAPESHLPLDRVAGLFWDYRDLLPGGPAGDALVVALGDRLQHAGLYQRAAALLEYQLFARTRDLAQGPLSARVASLFVLAGQPDHAITLLRRTDNADFTDDMLAERRRVQAVALYQTGRLKEALALLDTVPDGTGLQAEILWKQRNWQALADKMPALLKASAPSGLSDVEQTMVLRQAVALAMLGRGADLSALHQRYAAAFAPLPSGGVFNLLTGPVEAIDPATISRAMAAMPTASPVGAIADLIDGPTTGA